MIPEVRREPQELIARYVLEPNLRDIYLEGAIDKVIIELFFEKEQISNVVCYDVSVIDFSKLYQSNQDLYSNRTKLLFLGDLLIKHFQADQLLVRCVIDKDFDDILGVNLNNPFILLSDFSSIEGYFIERSILNKVFKIAFQNFPIAVDKAIEEIVNVCVELFLIRCTKIVKDWLDVRLLDIDTACKVNKDGSIAFKTNEYVTKLCLNNVSIKTQKTEYLKKIEELRSNINGDSRNYVHGHDFVNLFYKYVKVIKNTNNFKEENFEKALFLAIEVGDLKNYSLFNSLITLFT